MATELELVERADLRALNSFGVSARARWLARARSRDAVARALEHAQRLRLPVHVLGAGSNVVIAGDLDALVLLPELRGVEWLCADGQGMRVRAAAGENWHEFVQATLAHGACGLENLALIPGTVGAAPIQNIGAYGVELERFVVAVEAFDRIAGRCLRIDAAACDFRYRDSRFKREDGRHIIVAVEFALLRQAELVLDYAGVREELASSGVARPTAADIMHAVCAIRRRKLPDPARIGNAGSFFKNPLLASAQAQVLRERHPGLPVYPVGPDQAKLAAGWLIEQCGWKGRRAGNVGVHEAHALVLVNHGGASGADILALAAVIAADVRTRFGVTLEIEPRILR
ncbi:MAG: UDP-N-acetylmuramate dehydrogenase [Xanthomonadales bacterium]|nr:UDP-N-acetylenolpyruvoylglucosamine reductase [Xanthomonadales bacterium]MCC6592962.1 UDP-N-acetylmuramate dehydrogenase [Xanthomonadales bacterium]MCE7930603.1 UDP-N-acetylmuramate dehydrogenase [Xanthomonadales bacterium PRO6]